MVSSKAITAIAQNTAIGKKIAASTIAVPLQEFARRKIRKNCFNEFLDPGSEDETDNYGDSDQYRYLHELHTSARIFKNLFHNTSFQKYSDI